MNTEVYKFAISLVKRTLGQNDGIETLAMTYAGQIIFLARCNPQYIAEHLGKSFGPKSRFRPSETYQTYRLSISDLEAILLAGFASALCSPDQTFNNEYHEWLTADFEYRLRVGYETLKDSMESIGLEIPDSVPLQLGNAADAHAESTHIESTVNRMNAHLRKILSHYEDFEHNSGLGVRLIQEDEEPPF